MGKSRIKALEDKITEKYFDKEKIEEREVKMIKNIENELVDGKNLIITGVWHLTSLKKTFPESILFLRD